MLNITVVKIIALLTHYGYFMVFPISILEGPTISTVSGFLVSTGTFNPIIVFLVLVLGDVVGDLLYYYLGYFGGRKVSTKWGKYIGVTEKRIIQIEGFFDKHDWKILFFGKTQAIGSVILFVAGISKVSVWRFIVFNLIGTIPKIILFMTIGYYFGKAFASINTYVNYFAIGSIIFSLLLLGAYLFFKRYIKKHTSEFNI